MSRLFQFAMIAAMMALPAIAMGGDAEITQSIVNQLKAKKSEGSLKGFNIGLRVEEGVVWLEGHVSNPAQHDVAIDIARRVSGVQRVVDGIRIEGDTVAAPELEAPAEPVSAPRELAAADLTEEAVEEVVLEPQGEFSFSPVKPVSAERPAADESAMAGPSAAPLRQLRPVPASEQARPMPGMQPAYQVAANTNARANSAQPMVAPPAYYPAQYGQGGYYRPVRYDHPQMPGYAWPAYAAYPNYAAVTYPRQYSPQAWPYIGPFYPYPQVPLGWRKVEMEWKDGWWTLDFKARRHHAF